MAANTLLTVNFSFTDGGGSGKFDMILPIALVKETHAARHWTYGQRPHLSAILAIKAVDSTIPHTQVQCRIREQDAVPAAAVTDSASSRLT
ncbi:hypothetical protein CY34DRAFT_535002 [Suillus luteus UH-Slu-Lm8-n1]|uniref:Uncharacterized protein n=1 Tax=Suillus luteus UH-Slu-Lm8-n1 TaxID=930992 RepID=A0A0D0BQQ0_9AGAM|nr:hypothetical protein CY34DRAFT_535002 [Suillus luteus UH-Slu-Lm8-n1]